MIELMSGNAIDNHNVSANMRRSRWYVCPVCGNVVPTYNTLRDMRKNMLAKLSRLPMGTILDTPSGQYKTTIVDRVEGMEPTLAHLIPEMTANVLVPLAIAVYIFVLDWRMGLVFLAATVIGMVVATQSGKSDSGRQRTDKTGEGSYAFRRRN